MKSKSDSRLSRRDFLRTLGVGTMAITAMGMLPAEAQASGGAESTGPTWGVLIDLTRCKGCDSCALACKEANKMPDADVVPDKLSPSAYTYVERRAVDNAEGMTVTRNIKRQCMHCLDASCISACPAGAMHASGEGPVIYDPKLCLGCRYCQLACPFEIPRFNWDDGITPVINKCWMCFTRLQEGQLPACVEACPTGALRFGRREDLLIQAQAQIASNPGRYIDHIYGEYEVGGTSMLYISDTPFEQLGFRTLPDTAPAEETDKVMSTLPYIIGGMATLMTGTTLVTHRKPTKKAAEIADAVPASQPEHTEE